VTAALTFSLLVLAAAAVCALYVARDIEPAWFVSAGIAGTVFSGHWQDMGLPASVVPPDRLVIAAGLLMALIQRRVRLSPVLGTRAVDWLLTLTLAYAVGSAAWEGTLSNTATLIRLLDVLGVVPFVLFLAAPVVFATARARAILLLTLVATGLYLSATSLFQYLGADALVFPRYVIDPTVGIHASRARGPFVEAVANGLALYACGVASVIAAVVWQGRAARIGGALRRRSPPHAHARGVDRGDRWNGGDNARHSRAATLPSAHGGRGHRCHRRRLRPRARTLCAGARAARQPPLGLGSPQLEHGRRPHDRRTPADWLRLRPLRD
jgi:hypothetical protein